MRQICKAKEYPEYLQLSKTVMLNTPLKTDDAYRKRDNIKTLRT